MASLDLRKELLDCSVCLNNYTDPVTLRCGHNFCRECIVRVLDTQQGSGVYSCPECRSESTERPTLMRNITLCNIVESFLQPPPAQEQNGIFCTYCVDSPVPAVKLCLHCEAFLCDKHLRVHNKAPEHVLMEPTTPLENRKCSVHRELLKYYCIKDSVCICVSCRLDGGHQGHKAETLDEASEKKKKKLKNVLQELITKREETEGKVQNLYERKNKVQGNAADEEKKIRVLFQNLRRQLDDLETRVLSEISRQEEKFSSSISDLIKQLESKKDELSRKIHHIEEMCKVNDPLIVLQRSDMGGNEKKDKQGDGQLHGEGHLDVGLTLQTLHTLSDIIRNVKIEVYIPNPADILLNVNTAQNNLCISGDRKKASWSEIDQKRPETPERFVQCYNVLSKCSFSSGQHYWDIKCREEACWEIGMCYRSIERKGTQSQIGHNDKSWWLKRKTNLYSVIHDNKETQLPHKCSSNRVRISLNYEAGQLSFYELCDPIRHLHTFTTTFTEPLHAVLCVYRRKRDDVHIDNWVQILNS